MGGDLARSEAFRRERQDDLVDTGEPSLSLPDDLWIERGIGIAGHLNLDRPDLRQLIEESVRSDQLHAVSLGLRQQLLRQLLVIDLRLIHRIECLGHDLAFPPSKARRVGQTQINRLPDSPWTSFKAWNL